MKLAIACGGSGGHLTPALSLASALKEEMEEVEIIFVVSQKPLDRKMLGEGKTVLALPVVGMPRFFSWRFPIFLAKFSVSFLICFFWALRRRPDLFVGFGGYVSGPVILTGALLHRPTLIHEENFIPGRANLLLSGLASRVAVAFEETKKCFRDEKRVVCVGNPLRKDLVSLPAEAARTYFGLTKDRFTLLVVGGSQGAHRLNEAMVEAFDRMPEEDRSSFQVIHLTGEQDAGWVESRYHGLGVYARVYPFLEKMGEAYSAADLVVARGGAMTITEVGHFKKPALLVPLAIARNHQLENVRYLSERGACVLFEEERAMTEEFPKEILNLKRDPSRRKALSEKLATFSPNGTATRLAREVIFLAKGSKSQ